MLGPLASFLYLPSFDIWPMGAVAVLVLAVVASLPVRPRAAAPLFSLAREARTPGF